MTVSSIKAGTWGTPLALCQANWVKTQLEKKNPGLSVEVVIIKKVGDKNFNPPLSKVGDKYFFVKEIEEALLKEDIDLAVHSMKDMPPKISEGLYIGAVPNREITNDVLISKDKLSLFRLKSGARIGTRGHGRMAQLLFKRPDIKIVQLQGDMDTRLRTFETENLDGIILAAADILRMNMGMRITEYLDETFMLPAVGQGALCIETRKNDYKVLPFVAKIDERKTRSVIMGERAFLHRLGCGSQVPLAALGKVEENTLSITGLIADPDGKKIIKETMSGSMDLSETIGEKLGDILLCMGAKQILDDLK